MCTTFGLFVTPRLNARWSVSDAISLKAAAGKGWRTSVPLAEFAGHGLGIEPHVDVPGIVGRVDLPRVAARRELEPRSQLLCPSSPWATGMRASTSTGIASTSATGCLWTSIRRGRRPSAKEASQSRSIQAEFWWDWTKRLDITLAYRWADASRITGTSPYAGPVRGTASRLHDSGLRFASGRQGPTVARGCDVPGHRAAAFAVDLEKTSSTHMSALGGADVRDGQRADQPRLCRRPTDLCGSRT